MDETIATGTWMPAEAWSDADQVRARATARTAAVPRVARRGSLRRRVRSRVAPATARSSSARRASRRTPGRVVAVWVRAEREKAVVGAAASS